MTTGAKNPFSVDLCISFKLERFDKMVWFRSRKIWTQVIFLSYIRYVINKIIKQSDKIEFIQKRALRIIHGDQVFGMPYDSLLFLSNIERLHQRRANAGKTFFDGVCQETSCLNHLLPDKRDPHNYHLKDVSPHLVHNTL